MCSVNVKRNETVKEITYISRWVKDGYGLTVFSNGKEGEKIKTFTFSGPINPFPCFSMESTFEVLSGWLRNNGWKQIPGYEKHVITHSVDYDGSVSSETIITKYVSLV